MTITAAERDAIALIANVASVCGVERVAKALRDGGYQIDELGRVVEKIGECEQCRLNAHVIYDKWSSKFLCLSCWLDSLEGADASRAPGLVTPAQAGDGAAQPAAPEPVHSQEAAQ